MTKTSIAFWVLLLAPFALSQEGPRPAKAVAAWKGTIRRTVERTGTFVPAAAAELKLDLKVYKGELRFEEVVPHGNFVNEGDVIARLKTKAIDEQLERARMALERSEMSMRHTEENNRMKLESDAEALERAQTDSDRAAKRLRGYREHEKAFTEESERMGVQMRRHRLEDQQDELEQLEKMYSEDELVDATEEIVLKRSRRNFARSQSSFDLSERRRVHNKEWYFPWREDDLVVAASTKARSLERTKRKQEMGREKTATDMKQKRYDLAREREKLADLKADREQFVVRAPRRGILLHGAADAAPWKTRHEAGGTIKNRAVFATVADPKKLKVKLDLPEADVLKIKATIAATVTPTAAPERTLVGRLKVDFLPSAGARGETIFKAEVPFEGETTGLRPGLTCTVKAVVAEARDVVLVPKTAVYESNGDKVVRTGTAPTGPFTERKVETGLSDAKNIVILEGVVAGDYVLPQPKK